MTLISRIGRSALILAVLLPALLAGGRLAHSRASEKAAPATQPPAPIVMPLAEPKGMKTIPLIIDQGRAAATASSSAAAGKVLSLALHKTQPIDLPADVQDIVVGNPEIADVIVRSPRQVYVSAKALGDTNIFFLGRNGELLRRLEVAVRLDVQTLQQTLREMLPDERIEVSAVNDTIFLKGKVRSAAGAANAVGVARRFVAADTNVVNMMQVAGEQQVLLRVRVAEIQRSALKEVDVQANLDLQANEFILSALTAGGATTVAPFGGATITGGSGSVSLNLLEQNGLVKTLAEPNLTAVSGEEAKMLAGGEFPLPVSEDDRGRVIVEYKPFGVSLGFIPVILGPGRISLKVSTEVSALSTTQTVSIGSITLPTLTVRRASTTVELPSGGSLMIAGLLSNDITSSLAGLPGLKDLPILGALFRSSSFKENESELVITVTAYVVEPADHKAIALPTDGFIPASDLDRYLMGRLHKVYLRPERQVPAEGLQGPLGYIVE